MSYGAMIRDWRLKRKWTQRQLADLIGCSDGYIAHVENGTKLPSLNVCMALVEAFQLTPEQQQKLFEVVETFRRRQADHRIRTRGSMVREALRSRNPVANSLVTSTSAVSTEELSHELAADLAADADLWKGYNNLKTALANPHLRETVLNTLHALAQQAKPSDS